MADSYTFKGQYEKLDAPPAETGLIAAAPDLLASLTRMLLEFDLLIEAGTLPDVRQDIIFVDARAAITKATT